MRTVSEPFDLGAATSTSTGSKLYVQMSNGAQPASGVTVFSTKRELGSRSPPCFAATREPNELVALYRFTHASDSLEPLLQQARCLEKHWHPNIARVKHAELVDGELSIATELVDGATLADLLTAAAAKRAQHAKPGAPRATHESLLPLPVLVRIALDVVGGLQGLHGLRDEANAPLGVIHGAVCPENIVVGKDGVARLVNVVRELPVRLDGSTEAVGYAAPEALDVGGTSDPRADLHAVGVILWEVLSGRRLYEERDPLRVLARQRQDELPPPTLPAGSPFDGLADVVMCAVAFDPALRFKSAAEMASALRSIASARIAAGSVVASCVAQLAGERIRARRIELDPSGSRQRRCPSEAVPASEPAPDTSTRITLPPGSMPEADEVVAAGAGDALDDGWEATPPSSQPSSLDQLSLRELISTAPPLHESSMVGYSPSTATARTPQPEPAPFVAPKARAAAPPRPPPLLARAAPTPSPAPVKAAPAPVKAAPAPVKAAPAPVPVKATPAPVKAAPEAAVVALAPSSPMMPASSPTAPASAPALPVMAAPVVAALPMPAMSAPPMLTISEPPVHHEALELVPVVDRTQGRGVAVSEPRSRRRTAAIVAACLSALLVVATVFGVRAALGERTDRGPAVTATAPLPTTELPSTAVTAPSQPAATTAREPASDAPAPATAPAPAPMNATATPIVTAPTAPTAPPPTTATAAPSAPPARAAAPARPAAAPRPAPAPAPAPARPKKRVYEPLGI